MSKEKSELLPDGLGVSNLSAEEMPKPTDADAAEREKSKVKKDDELPMEEAPLHGHSRM